MYVYVVSKVWQWHGKDKLVMHKMWNAGKWEQCARENKHVYDRVKWECQGEEKEKRRVIGSGKQSRCPTIRRIFPPGFKARVCANLPLISVEPVWCQEEVRRSGLRCLIDSKGWIYRYYSMIWSTGRRHFCRLGTVSKWFHVQMASSFDSALLRSLGNCWQEDLEHFCGGIA